MTNISRLYLSTSGRWFTSRQRALTVRVQYGLVRHSCPQLIGCVANVFAFVLVQRVHGVAKCVECE